MTASVELALISLVLWLSTVLDTMTFSSAVETLVILRWEVSFAFTLLLLIP